MTTQIPTPEPELPESLREFLDAGGELSTLAVGPYYDWLCDLVVTDRRKGTLDTEKYDGGISRETQIELAEEYPHARERILRSLGMDDLFRRWQAELQGDEELCERVEAAMPADEVAWRLDSLEAERRPFFVSVEHRDSYVCGVTGEERSGPAVVITGRSYMEDELKDLPHELVFSPEVVEAALSEVQHGL